MEHDENWKRGKVATHNNNCVMFTPQGHSNFTLRKPRGISLRSNSVRPGIVCSVFTFAHSGAIIQLCAVLHVLKSSATVNANKTRIHNALINNALRWQTILCKHWTKKI